MRNGQTPAVCPKIKTERSRGSVVSNATAASSHIATTGAATAIGTQPGRRPGRASRATASRPAAPSAAQKASLAQNIGTDKSRSSVGLTPSHSDIKSVAMAVPADSAIR